MADSDPANATPGGSRNPTGKGGFKPGDDPRRVPNPTGRPPKVLATTESVRELAMQATESSVVLLHQIVDDPREHIQNRLQAAKALLNLGGATFPRVTLATVQHRIGAQSFDVLMQQASALLEGRNPPPGDAHPMTLLAHSIDNGPATVIDVPVMSVPDELVPQAAGNDATTSPAAQDGSAPTFEAANAPALVLVHPVPAPPAHLVSQQPAPGGPYETTAEVATTMTAADDVEPEPEPEADPRDWE